MAESPADLALSMPESSEKSHAGAYAVAILAVILVLALGALVWLLWYYYCYKKKNYSNDDSKSKQSEGIRKSSTSRRDLESRLDGKRIDSEFEAERQFMSSAKDVKGSGKKNKAEMVHGYDKRLSSAKVNSRYFRKFMEEKYDLLKMPRKVLILKNTRQFVVKKQEQRGLLEALDGKSI
ncbi:hypothetical protein DCAR_0936094 [Daucus carota subsp. sativus]|uniref:Uncharacterized protein n=1 Tax=Daucus carota subsp. sativus TaxID=79200 RepID=A0A175YJA1_DAUCS|nr:hypothetical protein DCAR_0936094 [Daucus carota subsp. sativus]